MIIRNLEDKVARCYAEDSAQFSDFMTMEEISQADRLLRNTGLYYRFWGGYDGAQRQMVMLSVDEVPADYPLVILCGQWDKFAEISHRDILGAVLASGIERRCIGDILFDGVKRKFYLFALSRMSDYISKTVTQAGRCSISWSVVNDLSVLPQQPIQEHKVSVPSLRIDAVISSVFHLSRQKALDLISEKRVFVDHSLVVKVTHSLHEGCSVVVRGHGKFIFVEQSGLSKKGKLYILIKQYM